MPDITEYRVFIACPGDLATERAAVIDVIEEINSTHGVPLNYRLRPVWYGKDAAAGFGPPQAVVNEFLQGQYELFVGLMWKRFGTPTVEWKSGTEEEYRLAHDRCSKQQFPLLFYFLQKPFMPASDDDLAQVGKVLAFRAELQSSQFTWDCADLNYFRDRVRKDLCLWMNELTGARKRPKQQVVPETAAMFHDLWPRMEPNLQAAFAVAYNENRRVGDGGIQTRDLFSALLRVAPAELQPMTQHIPEAALPPATSGAISATPYVATEMPWLSHCVASAVRRLGESLPEGRKLTAMDIFTEIAIHGSGDSVKLLRDHNITPEQIESIVTIEGLDVVSTGTV